MLKDTKEWIRGRLGEIVIFFTLLHFGFEMDDLADRTHDRAPLLHSRRGVIRSPDARGVKTAHVQFEFKTKTKHERWRGGGKDDPVKVSARVEQGIDRRPWLDYRMAERRWRIPVVLCILAIEPAEILAATLAQLGEPRRSPNESFDIVNWDIRRFSRIASFDPQRLHRFFNSKEPRLLELHERWLERIPPREEVEKILKWLDVRQGEFEVIRQHVFDQIERGWK